MRSVSRSNLQTFDPPSRPSLRSDSPRLCEMYARALRRGRIIGWPLVPCQLFSDGQPHKLRSVAPCWVSPVELQQPVNECHHVNRRRHNQPCHRLAFESSRHAHVSPLGLALIDTLSLNPAHRCSVVTTSPATSGPRSAIELPHICQLGIQCPGQLSQLRPASALPGIERHPLFPFRRLRPGGLLPRLPSLDCLGLLGPAFRCPGACHAAAPIVCFDRFENFPRP